MMKRLAAIGAVVLVVLGGTAGTAAAQSNVEQNAGIQFDFLSPGARSLALGGAFTVADDATAAFTNPSGLREVSKREFSFEGRIRGFDTPFTLRGNAFGTASGQGVDTIAGLVDGKSSKTVGGLSFASFVYPHNKWRIAGYRHEVARFKSDVTTEGAFYGGIVGLRLLPVKGTLDLTVVDYGLSGSYNLSPRVTVGGGIVFYDSSFDSTMTRFQTVGTVPASYSLPANTQTQKGDGNDVGVNVGITVEPSSALRLAAVYRRGGSLDVAVRNTGSANEVLDDRTGTFKVPDVFSLGFRANGKGVSVSADYTRVQYSQLTDGLVVVAFNPFLPTPGNTDYVIDDGNEFHAGAQYFNPNWKAPIAFRGGVWYDPAHSLVYTGPDAGFQVLFRERDENKMHYAFGAGFGIRQVELNVGVDLSKLVKTTSISTVIRF